MKASGDSFDYIMPFMALNQERSAQQWRRAGPGLHGRARRSCAERLDDEVVDVSDVVAPYKAALGNREAFLDLLQQGSESGATTSVPSARHHAVPYLEIWSRATTTRSKELHQLEQGIDLLDDAGAAPFQGEIQKIYAYRLRSPRAVRTR